MSEMQGTLEHHPPPDQDSVTIRRTTVERVLFSIAAICISAFLGVMAYMARDVVTQLQQLNQGFNTVSIWQARVDAVLESHQEMLRILQQSPDRDDYEHIRQRVDQLEGYHNNRGSNS